MSFLCDIKQTIAIWSRGCEQLPPHARDPCRAQVGRAARVDRGQLVKEITVNGCSLIAKPPHTEGHSRALNYTPRGEHVEVRTSAHSSWHGSKHREIALPKDEGEIRTCIV